MVGAKINVTAFCKAVGYIGEQAHFHSRRLVYQRLGNIFDQLTHLLTFKGYSSALLALEAAEALLCSRRSNTPRRLSSTAADSVGCAPFLSQARAFSSSILTMDGSTRGLYQPRFSMMRPSRGARESATTTR